MFSWAQAVGPLRPRTRAPRFKGFTPPSVEGQWAARTAQRAWPGHRTRRPSAACRVAPERTCCVAAAGWAVRRGTRELLGRRAVRAGLRCRDRAVIDAYDRLGLERDRAGSTSAWAPTHANRAAEPRLASMEPSGDRHPVSRLWHPGLRRSGWDPVSSLNVGRTTHAGRRRSRWRTRPPMGDRLRSASRAGARGTGDRVRRVC